MKVEQKTYAQVIIASRDDFIFSSVYNQYEMMCPFLCFPGPIAADFRTTLKTPEDVVPNKDCILLLEDYWKLLASEEKKAILDHELGHIASGHLKKLWEYFQKNGSPPPTSEVEEKEADAYSVDMNGSKAMHNGLLKALDVMVAGFKRKGYRVTAEEIIKKDSIIRNRLNLLKEQGEQPNA